jgi:hypothetical protein
MKYIYYIIFIACALSAGIIFLIQSKPIDNNTPEFAIAINDRIISIYDFKNRSSLCPPHISKDEFIESVVVKELLIQEARKLGIDKEESFRLSIQDFYEQSLTKILLERKYNELKGTQTTQKTDRYLDLLGREISLSLISPNSAPDAEQTPSEHDEQSLLTDRFDNLSTDLKMKLLSLQPGEQTGPLKIFGKNLIIRLNSIGEKSKSAVTDTPRSDIDKIIDEYNKELSLQKWLDELREKSSIRINKDITT